MYKIICKDNTFFSHKGQLPHRKIKKLPAVVAGSTVSVVVRTVIPDIHLGWIKYPPMGCMRSTSHDTGLLY